MKPFKTLEPQMEQRLQGCVSRALVRHGLLRKSLNPPVLNALQGIARQTHLISNFKAEDPRGSIKQHSEHVKMFIKSGLREGLEPEKMYLIANEVMKEVQNAREKRRIRATLRKKE